MNIRYPSITGGTPQEQITQVGIFLHQLVDVLNMEYSGEITSQVQNIVKISETSSSSVNQPTPEETFDSIKSLIIKSAEIVDAYTETIEEELKGSYVAVSDFGIYKDETTQKITETSEYTERKFSETQIVLDSKADISTIGDLEAYVKETKGYIKTGKVAEEEGAAVYGVEIGQGEGEYKRCARFTAKKLSFFDENGNETAYISNDTIFINSARINRSLDMGGWNIKVNGGDLYVRNIGGMT